MWELIPREELELRLLHARLRCGGFLSLTSIRFLLKAPLNWLLSKCLKRDRRGWITLSVPEMFALRAGERRRGSPYALQHYHTYDLALKSNEGWALFFIGYGTDGEIDLDTESTPAPVTSPESSGVPAPSTPRLAGGHDFIEYQRTGQLPPNVYWDWQAQRPPSQKQ